MKQLAEFIILTLATWRICNLIVNEDGPYKVFEKLRDYFQIMTVETENGQLEKYSPYEFGKLISCIWCLSPYVALILYLVSNNSIGKISIMAFALSSGALLFNKNMEK